MTLILWQGNHETTFSDANSDFDLKELGTMVTTHKTISISEMGASFVRTTFVRTTFVRITFVKITFVKITFVRTSKLEQLLLE